MKYEGNPGILLRQLADKSREVAEQRASKQDLTNAWSGVGFSLCGHTLVAPMGEVVEIITLPRYTLIPAVKPWVMGIANVRGKLLPIIDTEHFFGSKLTGAKNSFRVLIVETASVYVGLVVSKVFGLQHFDGAAFQSIESGFDQPFACFTEACALQDEQPLYRFSP
ncbi:MAG: chemotaxis protein CheW, partial [Gammaproteobacteria bacterium]|nr:chemotaxis protein CheW [Gammaproteobacteria bacterium]